MEVEKTHRHFIIYKPYGYLSQFRTGQSNRKKKMLGELHSFPDGTMAIGRLDADSEGLLLLTTDGKVSAEITSSKFEKEYWVQVDGIIDQNAINKIKAGLEISIEGKIYKTKPCEAKLIDPPQNLPERAKKVRDDRHGPTSWASVILREGKFRQVKKMTAVVGFPTLRLIRVRIGNIHLNNLNQGEVIETKTLNA